MLLPELYTIPSVETESKSPIIMDTTPYHVSINWTIGKAACGVPSHATYIITENAMRSAAVKSTQLITHLYPNPVADKLHVNIQQQQPAQLSVNITDTAGRVIRSQRNLPHSIHITTAIDFSTLSSGYYGVEIYAGNKRVYTAQVIKQ